MLATHQPAVQQTLNAFFPQLPQPQAQPQQVAAVAPSAGTTAAPPQRKPRNANQPEWAPYLYTEKTTYTDAERSPATNPLLLRDPHRDYRDLSTPCGLFAVLYTFVFTKAYGKGAWHRNCVKLSDRMDARFTHVWLENHTTWNTLPIDVFVHLCEWFGDVPHVLITMCDALFDMVSDRYAVDDARIVLHDDASLMFHKYPHMFIDLLRTRFEDVNKVALREKWWAPCSAKQLRCYVHDQLVNDRANSGNTALHWADNSRFVAQAKHALLQPQLTQHANRPSTCAKLRRTFAENLRVCRETYQHETAGTDTNTRSSRTLRKRRKRWRTAYDASDLLHGYYTTDKLRHAECTIRGLVWTHDGTMAPAMEPEWTYHKRQKARAADPHAPAPPTTSRTTAFYHSDHTLDNAFGVTLDTTQAQVAQHVLQPDVMCAIVQGGAGTGKTQIGVALMLEYAARFRQHVVWCAPTHEATQNAKRRFDLFVQRARKQARDEARLPPSIPRGHVQFMTMHSLCGKWSTCAQKLHGEARTRGIRCYNNDGELAALWVNELTDRAEYSANGADCANDSTSFVVPTVVLVDETSMADSLIFARLVSYVRLFAVRKVVLIGDRHQLQPVGRGCPFVDFQRLAETFQDDPQIPHVKVLHKNYRSEGVGIVTLSQNLIDPDFVWTVQHDVAENADVTLLDTSDDVHTTDALVHKLQTLTTTAHVRPATMVRVRPRDPTTPESRSCHVITPNNKHVLPFAHLVRKTVAASEGRTLPDGLQPEDVAIGDVMRFDKNHKKHFYYNGMLGTVAYIVADDARSAKQATNDDTDWFVCTMHHDEMAAQRPTTNAPHTTQEAAPVAPAPVAPEQGVLALRTYDPFLRWVFDSVVAPFREAPTSTVNADERAAQRDAAFADWAPTWKSLPDTDRAMAMHTLLPRAHQYLCTQHKMTRHTRSNADNAHAAYINKMYDACIDPRTRAYVVCTGFHCFPRKTNECSLSYASTVHKAQGGEADYVFVVCPHSMRYPLSRCIGYTAFTRAKRHLYLVGDAQAFQQVNRPDRTRTTMLSQLYAPTQRLVVENLINPDIDEVTLNVRRSDTIAQVKTLYSKATGVDTEVVHLFLPDAPDETPLANTATVEGCGLVAGGKVMVV